MIRSVGVPHERWIRAEEILYRASALPEHERAQGIADMCGDDHALEAEVMSLLRHAQRMENFLEEPALGTDFVLLPATANAESERDEMIGRTVGRYRIERRIASGGMGTVYLALRADEEFTQRVALKIVKRGMDTDEILERFRRERQTLAALEHPNIARLIDGGATPTGQPYLVMEFVEGEPIDDYCDHQRLGIDARLALFVTVCDAVRYAHQNLVVHRDLKPSNVLVASDGTPKLLDFGIAAVIDANGGHPVTAVQERRLTPEYASPEQVAGSAVATTSDVYSLGVILYELLSGCRPYRFTTRTSADVQHVVVDTEPAAPSEALQKCEPSSARQAAAERGCKAEQLVRRLRGDLDTIVLATLRKEPDRRYSSVEQLVTDLRRHERGLPVSARRDTFAYRASKFVTRHALACTLATLSFLLLVAGGASFAWQARVAERERDAAYVARAQGQAVTEFLRHMLASADPSHSGRDVTVREVIDDAGKRLDAELADQPLVQASLRSTIGSTYVSLGLYEKAEPELRRALEQRRDLLGPRHHDVARSSCELAVLLYGQHALDESAALLEEALGILRGEGGTETADFAEAESSLGAVRRTQGRLDEGERLQRSALEVRRRVCGEDSVDVAESLNNLASVLTAEKRLDEAQPLLEDALRIRRAKLGPEHPLVAQSIDNLAVITARKGDFESAEPLYREALDLEVRILGEDHPDVAVTRRNLGLLLSRKGKLAEAEQLLRASLSEREKILGPSDPRRVITALDLAEVLVAEGQDGSAEPLLEGALDATASLGPENELRAGVLARAAGMLQRRSPERAAELRAELARAGGGSPPGDGSKR